MQTEKALVGYCKYCATFWHKVFDTNYFWEYCPRNCQRKELSTAYFKFRPPEFWEKINL